MVGEGGMQPEYFHTLLTFYEADDYMQGVNRRYRTQWEAARWTTTFIARCAGNKNYTPPEFSWDRDPREPDNITPEDIDRLKEEGLRWASELNKKAQS